MTDRDALAALIKNAYYHARDHGGTMHTAADDAADAILAAGWVGHAPVAEHGERDDLVAVVAGVFTAMHQHPRYCEAIADAIIAAGWKHVPDDLLINHDSYSCRACLQVLVREDHNEAAVQRVRALCDEADAMSPEDYKTGQAHLTPAFREINYQDAFMALAKIINRIEAALAPSDPATEEASNG